MTEYLLKKTNDYKLWDNFVQNSPQGTYFNQSFYLESLNQDYEIYFIYKGTEIIAGLCLFTDDKKNIIEHPFFIYSNILYKDFSNLKNKSKIEKEFTICEFIVEILTSKYKNISITIHPSINDIKPFLWYNYNSDKRKFTVNIKYTSFLNIAEIHDSKNKIFIDNLRYDKRINISKSIKSKSYVKFTKDYEVLLKFYIDLTKKNKISLTSNHLNNLRNLIEKNLKFQNAIICNAYDEESIPIYSTMYFWDNKMAYYFLGAGDGNKNKWHATLCNYEMFKYLSKNHGIKLINLEGVNSPQRGKNKLGYGGNLMSYYTIAI